VRLLVDEVFAEYDERALTSALPPQTDTGGAARSCKTPSPASARCSATSTIRRSRRSGSTSG
jgi:hypothetical protein